MQDILDKKDIESLIDKFYKKVIADEIIGYFFTSVITLSWGKHIPIMISFWDTILFGTQSYKGNPMTKHIALSKLSPIENAHFERWMTLWKETINENFYGEKAQEAIDRAQTIALTMQYKINLMESK